MATIAGLPIATPAILPNATVAIPTNATTTNATTTKATTSTTADRQKQKQKQKQLQSPLVAGRTGHPFLWHGFHQPINCFTRSGESPTYEYAYLPRVEVPLVGAHSGG